MKITVCWFTLLQYAKELAQAEKSGNKDRIDEAKKRHDNYLQLCKEADEMSLNMPRSHVGF